MMGRPPKSLRQHKHDRTYRADRHGSRIADKDFEGNLPDRPADLTADEAEVWEAVVNTSPDGVLRSINTSELVGLCHWYGEWRRVMGLMRETRITDKKYFRLATLAAIAWKHFAAAASRFGMTPADRARLKMAPSEAKPDDPLESLKLIGAPRAS